MLSQSLVVLMPCMQHNGGCWDYRIERDACNENFLILQLKAQNYRHKTAEETGCRSNGGCCRAGGTLLAAGKNPRAHVEEEKENNFREKATISCRQVCRPNPLC